MIEPKSIKRDAKQGLSITWSDGDHTLMTCKLLRRECPCAECKMKRGEDSHSSPLTPKKSLLRVVEHTTEESLTIDQIWMVGNYALGMKWADGHDSGIYTFEYLRMLSQQPHQNPNGVA